MKSDRRWEAEFFSPEFKTFLFRFQFLAFVLLLASAASARVPRATVIDAVTMADPAAAAAEATAAAANEAAAAAAEAEKNAAAAAVTAAATQPAAPQALQVSFEFLHDFFKTEKVYTECINTVY